MLAGISRLFFLALSLSLLFGTSLSFAQDVPETSHFEKQVAGNRNLVVFVHGILGDGRTTWTNAAAYWPKMMASDPIFAGGDIFVYSYPTGAWATFSIDELAENLRLILNSTNASKYDNIAFLAHSMGGLVVRDFLLKNQSIATHTKFVYFYSTPTSGSEVAALVSLAIQSNPQLSKMAPMKSDDFLADQVRQWNDARYKMATYCAYEKRKTFGQQIVDMKSASLLCNQPLDPIDANHIDIVKPDSPNATSYLAFVAAYNEQLPSAAAQLSPAQSSDNSCLPAKMLTTLTSPSIPTKDGDGNTVGTLTDVSLAIIEVCKPPNDRATRYLLKYGYYNGSGTWRGEQNMNITLIGDKKFPLKVLAIPIDRGRCIYGGPEPRSMEGDLQGLGYLVQGLDVVVTAVGGVQTRC